MTDWKRLLKAVAPNARADIVAVFVSDADKIAAAGITTPLRIAHFLAQVVPESQGLTRLEENLNYSAQRLRVIWPKRFPTLAEANKYAKNPKALAEKVYGGRMGNVRPGDDYRYRGGGLGMTTGRSNYRAAGFEDHPEALRTPAIALASALTFWVDNHYERFADRDDVVGLRRVWNGGDIGLDETKAVLAKAKVVIRTLPAQAKLKALRYPVGVADGDPGDRTVGAVQLLQRREGLPVTGELDDVTLDLLDTAEPLAVAAKDADLTKSRTVQGSALAGTSGLGLTLDKAMELKDQVEQAQVQISAGTVLGFVAGVLIVAGAAYALYARWDDAGRPVPALVARLIPSLAGDPA